MNDLTVVLCLSETPCLLAAVRKTGGQRGKGERELRDGKPQGDKEITGAGTGFGTVANPPVR